MKRLQNRLNRFEIIQKIMKNNTFRRKIKVDTKRGRIPKSGGEKIMIKKTKSDMQGRINFVF